MLEAVGVLVFFFEGLFLLSAESPIGQDLVWGFSVLWVRWGSRGWDFLASGFRACAVGFVELPASGLAWDCQGFEGLQGASKRGL